MKRIRKTLHELKKKLLQSCYVFFYDRKKLQDLWVLLYSKNGQDLGSNLLRIAEELDHNPAYQNYTIYVACKKNKQQAFRKILSNYQLNRVKLIRESDFRFMEVLGLARYLFTDTSFPTWFVKKEGQIMTNTWHGTPLKKMGKDVKDEAYKMGNVQKNLLIADYLLYPSDYMRQIMVSAYFLDNLYQGKILYSGYPRNSVFFDTERGQAVRDKLGLNGKRLYGYMPTWRGNLDHILSEETEENLAAYFRDLDARLTEEEIFFVRLHPYMESRIDYAGYRHIRPFPDAYEPYDILNICDCLVTDYSSVMFDFANTGRKIILFVYDKEAYLGDGRGAYLSLEELPFPQVMTVEALVEELRSDRCYDDTACREKFCQYDGKDVARKVCAHIILQDKIYEEFTVSHNGKENVLLFPGGLEKNGITTAFLALLQKIDLEKRNYYVTFRTTALKEDPERVSLLPEGIGFLPVQSVGGRTWAEEHAVSAYFDRNVTNPFVRRITDRFFRRLYQRNFGYCGMDTVIHYSGYGKELMNMFQQAPVPRMIFVHNDMEQELKTKTNQHAPTLRRAYQTFEKVVLVSEDMTVPEDLLEGRKEHIRVVNDCFDQASVRERAGLPLVFDADTACNVSLEKLQEILNSPAGKIINIGRFSPEKGHDLLLDAFASYHREHPDSYLIIIGGYGDAYEETLQQAQSYEAADHTVIIRSISNPMPVLAACDLFVLSSRYEGFGLVLLEADALDVPVISTDIPGPRGIMQKYGGFLVPVSAQGLLGGMQAYDAGEVKTLGVDFTAYDQTAVKQFESLFDKN